MFRRSGLLSLLLLCPHLASAIKDVPGGDRTAGDDNTSSHVSQVRGHSRERGYFPPWYYRQANAMLDCSHEPKTHMYHKDRQSILGGLDKFFKELNVSYSLWGGSVIAVARASRAGVDAVSMPWDLDFDVILTESSWATVAALVPNIRTVLRQKPPNQLHAIQQTMKDLDSGITLMSDNLIRVMMSSYAHGDLSHKWLEKLLQAKDLNLDTVVPPGAYADVIGYKHISDDQLLVDCKLDGITTRCPAEVLDDTQRDAWVKKYQAYGDGWHEPDHYWDSKQCGFVCKTCNDETGQGSELLKELRGQDLTSSHKWGAAYHEHRWGPSDLDADGARMTMNIPHASKSQPIGAVQTRTSFVRREQALSAA